MFYFYCIFHCSPH